MKNIAIFGCSRSGKTTLAKMIAKRYQNYQVYFGDDIRWTFQNIFPMLNINSKGGSGMKDDFPKFLSELFYESIKRNKGEFNYIIETCNVKPYKAKELFDNDDTIVLFLGVSDLTIQEHFKEIRKYETKKDWSYYKTDEMLLEHCSYWVPESKKIKEECEKLNLWYVDTSFDREKVLQETLLLLDKKILE